MAFDPDRENAILEATLELLAELGYDRMSIDQIARRAGASKATIYRRWPGKAQLVTDVICRRMHTFGEPVPDTGSLRGDLLAVCRVFSRLVERKQSLVLGVLPAFLADPELARTLRENVPGPKLEQVDQVLERARARGELTSTTGPRELLSLVEAVIWHRLLLAGQDLDDTFLTATVDRVLLPILTPTRRPDPPT